MYKDIESKDTMFKSAVRIVLNSPEWQSVARICWGKERFDEWLKSYQEEKRKEQENYESMFSDHTRRDS